MFENDRLIVERALPAHLLVLMSEQVRRRGFEFRADLVHNLNMAAATPLADLDEFSISRTAKTVDDAARTILHSLSPDDPRDGLYCCAMFCVVLVDEGLIKDPRSQAVLVSLLLLDDVQDERPDENGELAVWHERESQWRKQAKGMLTRAKLLGFYLRT